MCKPQNGLWVQLRSIYLFNMKNLKIIHNKEKEKKYIYIKENKSLSSSQPFNTIWLVDKTIKEPIRLKKKHTCREVLECCECKLRRQSGVILFIWLVEDTEVLRMWLARRFHSVVSCLQTLQTRHTVMFHHYRHGTQWHSIIPSTTILLLVFCPGDFCPGGLCPLPPSSMRIRTV